MSIVWEGHQNILNSTAQALVVPVNSYAVMGKGLALQFKQKYPAMFEAYVKDCANNLLWDRGYFIHRFVDSDLETERMIYCFPTKKHWRDNSRLEFIHRGLLKLVEVYKQEGIRQIAVPALGCGEGKLAWTKVYPLLSAMLDMIDAEVGIYLPYDPL